VRLSVGRGRGRGAIFVGEADRPERLQWAVAHELGEYAVHRVFDKAEIAPDAEQPAIREQLANELARRILLPCRPFQVAGVACNWDLTELKQAFPSASP
jgi:Zn-dependent peptidase ImmA (M78 family)